jgi:hypothetical protein
MPRGVGRLKPKSVSEQGVARLVRQTVDEFYVRPAASLVEMVERVGIEFQDPRTDTIEAWQFRSCATDWLSRCLPGANNRVSRMRAVGGYWIRMLNTVRREI